MRRTPHAPAAAMPASAPRVRIGLAGLIRRAVGGDPNLERVLDGGALVLALLVGNVLLAFLTQAVLARWLGSAEYGVYTVAWTLAGILAVPAGLGMTTAVLRFIPAYRATDRRGHLLAILSWSRRAVALAGAALALAAAGLIALVPADLVSGGGRVALALGVALVPLLALGTLQISHGYAFDRPASGLLPYVLGSNVGLLFAVLGLSAAGVRPRAPAVLLCTIGVLAAVVVLQARVLRRGLPARAGARLEREVPLWLEVGRPLLLSALLALALTRLDILLVGFLLGPAEAGVYGAAARTALVAGFGTVALNTLAPPRIAELHAGGRHEEMEALATGMTRWTFWPTLIAVVALGLAGGPVLALFGAGFDAGRAPLYVLLAGQLAPAAVGAAPHLLNMTGHERAATRMLALGVAVAVLLAVLLVPYLGMLGAAIGTAAGLVVKSVGVAVQVRRKLGIDVVGAPRASRLSPAPPAPGRAQPSAVAGAPEPASTHGTPALSVLLPVYNVEEYVGDAIRSALGQTLDSIEVVIVDDGSTDGTWDVVRTFANDPRVVAVRGAENQGLPRSRNACLALARGEFVGFLDGDDLWLPEKAERHVAHLRSRPDLDASFGGWKVIGPDGTDTGRRGRPRPRPIGLADLLCENMISFSQVVARRSAIEAVGGCDPALRSHVDHDLWLRVAALRPGNFEGLPDLLAVYRRRPAQITSDWSLMYDNWTKVMEKARSAHPELLARVWPTASALEFRFLAFLAWEAGDPRTAASLLGRAYASSPWPLLRDRRAWLTTAAVAAAWLPAGLGPRLVGWAEDVRKGLTRLREAA